MNERKMIRKMFSQELAGEEHSGSQIFRRKKKRVKLQFSISNLLIN